MSVIQTTHAHITKTPGIVGGSACIAGTRFPVRSVVIHVLRHGMTPEELVRDFPYLSLAQVHDALSYYYDFQAEIDQEIEQNTETYWQSGLNGDDPASS
jgi:uncharacterized protein (DUF433 family)